MIDDEIRDATRHVPHRRVVQLEVRAKRYVWHGVEPTRPVGRCATNGQWNP
jgi:hypothetical protein